MPTSSLASSRPAQPAYGGQPGLGGGDAKARVESERLPRDAGDGPAVAEGGAQLVLADAARAGVAGLAVAEAHQVAGAARPQGRLQAGDVPGAAVVVEDVEHPAVDDRVQGHAELPEAQHVTDLEAGGHVPPGRLAARPLD